MCIDFYHYNEGNIKFITSDTCRQIDTGKTNQIDKDSLAKIYSSLIKIEKLLEEIKDLLVHRN